MEIINLFGRDDAESILTNVDSFIVVDAVLRHAGKFSLSEKCSAKVFEHFDSIAESNPGIITGTFAGIEDKDEVSYELNIDKEVQRTTVSTNEGTYRFNSAFKMFCGSF